ncbi:hypothetical protein [uncultured Thiodictyon sp.]|uniref:hypothetical protein n=1 Tax=uncultured Thiodictyon sp. TaxID=1846217 RepID=UPI0025F0DDB0|nr:hypothetical protein [uncultured Thiodictyon sp.]
MAQSQGGITLAEIRDLARAGLVVSVGVLMRPVADAFLSRCPRVWHLHLPRVMEPAAGRGTAMDRLRTIGTPNAAFWPRDPIGDSTKTGRTKMYADSLQLSIATVEPQQQERTRQLRGALTQLSLRDENILFERTRGISLNNDRHGFLPGFRDNESGDLAISRFADGSAAPLHVLDGLPENWIAERDEHGHVTHTCPGLVSGFIRDGRFYTRDEAARACAH